MAEEYSCNIFYSWPKIFLIMRIKQFYLITTPFRKHAFLIGLFFAFSFTNSFGYTVIPNGFTIDGHTTSQGIAPICPANQSHSFVIGVSKFAGTSNGRMDIVTGFLDGSGQLMSTFQTLIYTSGDFTESAFTNGSNEGSYVVSGSFNLQANNIDTRITRPCIAYLYYDYLTGTAEYYANAFSLQVVYNTFTVSPSSQTICKGASTTLTASGAATYFWALSGATTPSITVNPPITTTYTVSGTKLGCAFPAQSVTVNVTGSTVNAGSNQILYLDTPPYTLSGSPSGGTWSGPGVTSAGVFTAANAGTGVKTLTYSVTNGSCVFSSTKTITVNPLATNTTSLTFGGSNTRVIIPPIASYNNVGTGNFTIEVWLKTPTTAPASNPFFSNSDTDNGSGVTFSIINGNKLALKIFNTTINSNTLSLSNNTCYHLAVTRYLGTVTFYLNGVAVGSAINSGSIADTELLIGGNGDYGVDFTGSIDDVRFWNIYRTATDISSNMNIPIPGYTVGLIGYWNLNEGGEIVYDLSPCNNNGTLATSRSYVPPVRSNVSCYTNPVYNGLAFNNNQTYVTVPDKPIYDNIGTGNFTIEAWIKTPATQPGSNPFFSNSDTDHGFGVTFSISNGNQLTLKIQRTVVNSNIIALATNTCYHVSVTRSGGVNGIITFYLNGIAQGTAVNTNSIDDSDFFIGRTGDYGPGFIGNINEVRFWNIARSSIDISSNQTAVLSSTTAGLIGYWRFDEQNGQTIIDASSTGNNGYLGYSNLTDSNDPLRSGVSCFSADRQEDIQAKNSNEIIESSSNVIVYPNPFNDQLTIRINGEESASHWVEIVNAYGDNVFKGNVTHDSQLGQQLPSGLYYVKVTDGNQVTTVTKVIKQ